ncbi:MAG: type II toxin-antitoxin system VapC family toxin [Gemmatimonadota bacterium]
MRALDTNVLVYAEVRSTEHHDTALRVLREHAEGSRPWALPWPCAYEFLRVVTHPGIFDPPVPVDRALADLERILDSPSLELLSESPRHRTLMAELVRETEVSGNLFHDAHIAALCLEHGVRELVTGDRDFRRFPGLDVVDPFGG